MPILAEANRVKFSLFEEATFGVIPTGTKLQDLRITSENLKQDTDSTASNELRFDRQRSNLIRTGLRANGGFEFEFSYGSFDSLWQALLFSAPWTNVISVAAGLSDVTVTSGTKTYTSPTGWANVPPAGSWVLFSGFPANSAANGLKKVASSNANDIVVEQAVDTEAPGPAITADQGAQIVNGATKRSFTAELDFTDLAPATLGKFRHHTGLVPNTAELNVQTNGIITGSFGFLGSRELSAAVTAGDGANTLATTTQPMNAIENVIAVLESGQAIDITDFTLRVNNNLGERLRVGTLGAFDIRAGTIDVEGTLEGYYEDSLLIDKYLNWANTSLVLQFLDAAGHRYLIEVPRCKFSDGTRNATGINTDIKTPLSWTAFAHETELVTLKWYRWPAAA